MTDRRDPRRDPRAAAAGLFLPALRLDRDAPGEVREEAERALEIGVGGFLLFGGRAERVRALVSDLREAAGRPLWMAADLERGAGQQFRGAVQLPPPAGLARTPNPEEAARTAGRITGEEARRLGIDWVLAPVLDLDVEPENPIVGTRSFGADPDLVSRLGAAWIDGCQATGVAACAKHFPGHGRTTADSHLECPRVDADRDLLKRQDLAPFRAAAPAVASMMTAHVAYTRLTHRRDPAPATLNREIVSGLLRGSMGYEGLVVTDALVMEGLGGAEEDEGELVARAVRAGCDLFLYPRDLETAVDALARLVDAGDPEITERIRESRQRSRRTRRRYVRGEGKGGWGPDGALRPPGGAASGAAEKEGSGDAGGVGAEERVREALRLAVSSVTAVGNGDSAAALDPARPLRVHAVSDDLERAGEEAPFGASVVRELKALGWTAELAPGEDAAADGQRLVLLRSTPQADKGRASVSPERARGVLELLDAGGPAALVVFGHERLLRDLGRPGLCAWSAEDMMQRAAARALAGRVRGG